MLMLLKKIWDFFNKYDINGLVESNTTIEEVFREKKIINTIDILGRQSTMTGIYINMYNDGSVEKINLLKH